MFALSLITFIIVLLTNYQTKFCVGVFQLNLILFIYLIFIFEHILFSERFFFRCFFLCFNYQGKCLLVIEYLLFIFLMSD